MGSFDSPDFWLRLLIVAPPLLFSLTVHEFAHARTALAFGDPTARDAGRCTLNPLAHLDPLGTICLLFSGVIGWAKPVPVNYYNLHPPRRAEICVSLAGPVSNLLLGFLCGFIIKLLYKWHGFWAFKYADIAETMLIFTIIANFGLFAFNLIPLFPLDGHHIVRELLPRDRQRAFMEWQIKSGRMILMIMIFAPTILSNFVPGFKGRLSANPWLDPIGWLLSHTNEFLIGLLR